MKKVCLVTVTSLLLLVIGCYEGGEVVCGGPETFGDFSYVTTSEFDSIRIYLGNQRICYGDVGGYNRDVFCKTSLDSAYEPIILDAGGFRKDYRVDKKGIGKCISLHEFPPWFYFSCAFNSVNDGIDMVTSDLTIEIFYEGNKKTNVVENFVPGGFYNYFITVGDTAIYSNIEKMLKPNEQYDWTEKGCGQGLCFLQMPVPDEEYCFEK